MKIEDYVGVLDAVAGSLAQRELPPHKPERDSDNFDCPTHLIGRTFLHGRRGTLYKVAGTLWDGERDLWMVVFHNVNPNVSAIPYARKVGNFIGKLDDGAPRFVEVHDVASINPPPAQVPPAVQLKVRGKAEIGQPG